MKRMILAGVITLLTACTTQVPVIQHDYGIVTSGDFNFMKSNVRTYSWHPNSERSYLSDEVDSPAVTEMVRNAITHEMAQRGYQLQPSSKVGDMIVGFGLASESVLQDKTIFEYTNLSTGVPFYDENGKPAEKGSLYLVFYTPNVTHPQWQTLAQSGIEQGLSVEKRQERVTHYISMILRDVPTLKP